MDLNRRSILFGLYAAGLTGGLAFGMGAFTSVKSERDVEVRISSDKEDEGVASIFGRFVEYENDIAEFRVSDSTLQNAEGVNPEGETTLKDVLRVRIDSGNQAPYTVRFDDEDGLEDANLQFKPNDWDPDGYPFEISGVGIDEDVILDIDIDTLDEEVGPDDENVTFDGELRITIESEN